MITNSSNGQQLLLVPILFKIQGSPKAQHFQRVYKAWNVSSPLAWHRYVSLYKCCIHNTHEQQMEFIKKLLISPIKLKANLHR